MHNRTSILGNMNILKIITPAILLVAMMIPYESPAKTVVSLEGSAIWQTRNDQRVPGEGGTEFSLSDFDKGPFPGVRLYVGHTFNERHEIRALYAPLEVEIDGKFDQAVIFRGSTFAANTDTKALYKFNSYRLTYAYHLEPKGEWNMAWGFTGKIRDAEVRLTQGALRESKSNVGFVPLLHFQANRALSENWLFRFDFDGLAAPQGRAFDLAFFFERSLDWNNISAFGGYRTLEGGADNDEVFNFAWIHYAVLGLRGEF